MPSNAAIDDAVTGITRAIDRAFAQLALSDNDDLPSNLVAVGHGIVLALDHFTHSFSRIADSLERIADEHGD